MFTTSYKYTLSVVAALAVASSLSAGQVGTLTNFEANTTAKASEVNGNFIVLTDAINDNNTRLTTVETGYVSVNAAAFHLRTTEDCEFKLETGSGYAYVPSTSASPSCSAVAGLTLPDKSTITSFSCTIYNNDPSTTLNSSINLVRSVIGGSYESMAILSGGDDAWNTTQTISETTITDPIIENQNYSYYVYYYPDTTATTDDDKRIYSCTIGYTY